VVVNHVGLCVTDLARSQRFYEEALGFTVDRELKVSDAMAAPLLAIDPPVNLTAVYLRQGPFLLELLHFDRPGNPAPLPHPFNAPGLTHLSFSVTDLDETVARIPAAGGTVVRHLPGAAIVHDPDDRIIELLPMSYHHRVTGSAPARPGSSDQPPNPPNPEPALEPHPTRREETARLPGQGRSRRA